MALAFPRSSLSPAVPGSSTGVSVPSISVFVAFLLLLSMLVLPAAALFLTIGGHAILARLTR